MISNFTGKRKHEERERREKREEEIRESDKGERVGRLKVERETKMY